MPGAAPAWSSGGSRWPARSGPHSPTGSTGDGRCPGFGDPSARIAIIGLAPAAHGANRTGRMFTGDRSGDFLFAVPAPHRLRQPAHVDPRGDGLRADRRLDHRTRPLRAAGQQAHARGAGHLPAWLDRELALLPQLRVFVVLGSFGYEAMARYLGVRPRPKFGHGVEVDAGDGRTILCSYHVSQQNTFTGKLTEPMLDAVFERAKELTAKTGLMAHVEGLVGDRSLSGSACTAARCGLNGESSSPGGDSATSPCRTGRRGDRDHSAALRSPPGGRPLDSSTPFCDQRFAFWRAWLVTERSGLVL